MGVLACDRRGCPNIMCDYCILGNSLDLCSDCLRELTEKKERWPADLPDTAIEDRIRKFMNRERGVDPNIDRTHLNEVFDRLIGKPRWQGDDDGAV